MYPTGSTREALVFDERKCFSRPTFTSHSFIMKSEVEVLELKVEVAELRMKVVESRVEVMESKLGVDSGVMALKLEVMGCFGVERCRSSGVMS